MAKQNNTSVERRRFVRLRTPITISYTIPETNTIRTATTKNISADGLMFETGDAALKEPSIISLIIDIPSASNPVHAKGKVIWTKKTSLQDGAPIDCGVELIGIEEDNKNTFLKFLCDLLYEIEKESPHGSK